MMITALLAAAILAFAAKKKNTKPAKKPATKPAQKPATKPAQKPATKPAQKPATKPSTKPAIKPDAASAAATEAAMIAVGPATITSYGDQESESLAKHIAAWRYGYDRERLARWQRQHGLSPDGIYGPASAEALRKIVPDAPRALYKGGKK